MNSNLTQYAAGVEAYLQGFGKWYCVNAEMEQGWNDAHSEATEQWLMMMDLDDDIDMDLGEDVSYPSQWEMFA